MRKSPLNHLATAAVALLVWVIAVIWGAAYLGDNVTFLIAIPSAFQWLYRVVMSVLALAVILQCSYWYAYGARERTATDLPTAKRLWVGAWLAQVGLSGAAVAALWVYFIGEMFEPVHYGLMYGLAALQTWVTFWATTFFLSPRPVQYVPWGKG